MWCDVMSWDACLQALDESIIGRVDKISTETEGRAGLSSIAEPLCLKVNSALLWQFNTVSPTVSLAVTDELSSGILILSGWMARSNPTY